MVEFTQEVMKDLEHRQAQVVAIQAGVDLPVEMTTETYVSEGVELAMDIWHPNPEAFPGIRPGILFFFGGGFMVGTRKAFQKHCEECARQGYVAITADYRIGALYQSQARDSHIDGARAWMFVRENAERWSLDKDRIVIGGGSAGGMISAMCGRLSGVQPMGLVLYCPGVLDDEKGPERLSRLTGTDVDGEPVLWTKFAKAGDPPVLVIHGAQDTTVPLANAAGYVEYAKQQGVDATLVVIPDAVHGIAGYNGNRAHYFICLGETLQFLERVNKK